MQVSKEAYNKPVHCLLLPSRLTGIPSSSILSKLHRLNLFGIQNNFLEMSLRTSILQQTSSHRCTLKNPSGISILKGLSRTRPCIGRAQAKRKDDEDQSSALETVKNAATSAVDTIAAFVPESVPRQVAKGGVAVVGGLFIFGLIQKVISGIFTLAVMGAVGYWWLTKNTGTDDEDEPPKPKQKSSGSRSSDDLGDPLSEAQRIMDKYK